MVPFSASPYKKLPGAHPSWIKMDLSLMPEEIAEELGVEFSSIDPATTGEARKLPQKLRPVLVEGNLPKEGGGGGFLTDQTSGLISQLLAANWEKAPESLKRDIKEFLEKEISRSLAITQSIDGGAAPEETERTRFRTPDPKPIKANISEKRPQPPAPNVTEGETLWGDEDSLDQLIS